MLSMAVLTTADRLYVDMMTLTVISYSLSCSSE